MDSCLQKWGPELRQGVQLSTASGRRRRGCPGRADKPGRGEPGLGRRVRAPWGCYLVRMGSWSTGEREGGKEVPAYHTRTHTPGLRTACGSKCERACAAVSVRVCLSV